VGVTSDMNGVKQFEFSPDYYLRETALKVPLMKSLLVKLLIFTNPGKFFSIRENIPK